ncbi:hypothetical protein TNCV_1518261 [Trichonephila clavipes]|nr:hypothetical protein TNCV_1518261 [Trichonephila clavipes]
MNLKNTPIQLLPTEKFIFEFEAGHSFLLYCFGHGPKKLQHNSQRKGRENYTSPNRTANQEGSQLAHLDYYQPASKEPGLMPKDNTEELIELTLPAIIVPCRPKSPVDLTDRATVDPGCLKLQSIAYYIRQNEVLTEQSKNAINVLIENGFTYLMTQI